MNIQELETGLTHFKDGLEKILLGIAHFSAVATPSLVNVADIVEAASGNAELDPLTNVVGSAVKASADTIVAAQKV